MIRINLLPVREWQKRETARQYLSVFFLSFILLLTILGGLWITVQNILSSQRQAFNALEADKAKLSYVGKTLSDIEARRKAIKEKFVAIEALQKDRAIAVRIFDQIAGSVPADRLWLTGIVFKDQGLKLNGVALDNQTVALFMRRLETVPIFHSVNLTSTKRKPYQGQNLMDFEVQLLVKTAEDASKKDQQAQKNLAKGNKSGAK
ncbi:MAG: PilN domain-containing protein [Desulfobacteraceae bacterium]|nr:PilN domain-containing protein [Desulfobacteraceae bacterium]